MKSNNDHDHEHFENALLNLHPPKYYDTYFKLSSARVIFLNEDFSKETSAALTALLLYYDHENPEEEISIYINSNGGDASALTNIYDVIQMIKAPVQTICIGRAYSAGAFLLVSGTKGHRYMFKNAEVMIHGVQCLFPIPGEEHPDNSKSYLNFLTTNNNAIMKILSKHTGHSLEKVTKDCSKDHYLNAKEALEYGIIDHIV
jgi:ATP-dependent Clp protease protease subunit